MVDNMTLGDSDDWFFSFWRWIMWLTLRVTLSNWVGKVTFKKVQENERRTWNEIVETLNYFNNYLANNCVLIDHRQYNLSPGCATNLCANSLWNISTAHLKNGLWASSFITRGEEIWYGTFATHTSKNGRWSVLITSPTIIWSFDCIGVPCN